jgi:hypothetical protein
MISEDDKKFLANLKKLAAKATRQKARAEAAANAEEGSVEGAHDLAQLESEDEVDEITLLIEKEEKDNAEKAIKEES